MKFIQINNQIIISQNGGGQVAIGVVFAFIGLAIAGFGVSGKADSTNQAGSSHAGLWVTLFGAAFLTVGVLVILTAKKQRSVITKGGNVEISSKRLIGGQIQTQNFPVSTVSKITLQTYLPGNSSQGGTRQRRSDISFVLQNGEQVVIAEKSANGGLSMDGISLGSFMKAPLTNEANQMAAFLGLPLEAADMSTLSGAFRAAEQVIGELRDPTTREQVVQKLQNPTAATPILSITSPVTSSSLQQTTPTETIRSTTLPAEESPTENSQTPRTN